MTMFTQNEIILMIGVVSALLFCIIILTILDIRDYLREKKSLVEEEEVPYKEEFKEEEVTITPVEVMETEDNNDIKSNEMVDEILVNDIEKNDEFFFEEMEDEKFDVKEDVIVPSEETVIIPIKKQEAKPKKRLEVFEELDEIENNLPNKKDDVTNFEMEQERTAIISLDELMKKSNELYDSNETMQYDDGNEPISIDEVIKMFNKNEDIVTKEEKEVPVIMQDIVKDEPYSKKETIPFISSVYGIEKKDNALEFENTATYEKLDRKNYSDFVSKLREMEENK